MLIMNADDSGTGRDELLLIRSRPVLNFTEYRMSRSLSLPGNHYV
jgi:hypothetical protein